MNGTTLIILDFLVKIVAIFKICRSCHYYAPLLALSNAKTCEFFNLIINCRYVWRCFDDTIVNERFFVLVMPQSHRRGVLLYGSLRNLVKPQSPILSTDFFFFFFPYFFV